MIYSDQALRLEEDSLDEIVAWQRAAGSLEVCGLCAVDQSGAQHVLRLTNHSGVPCAFEISRSEERLVCAAAAERGWEIVAFLHTHPDHLPDLSQRDARCFERDTLPWIIIGTPASNPSQRTYVQDAGVLRNRLNDECTAIDLRLEI